MDSLKIWWNKLSVNEKENWLIRLDDYCNFLKDVEDGKIFCSSKDLKLDSYKQVKKVIDKLKGFGIYQEVY